MKTIISISTLTLLIAGFLGCSGQNDNPVTAGASSTSTDGSSEYFGAFLDSLDAIAPSSLSQKELEGLVMMREEEKVARDVYITLGNKYSLRIFSNIQQSEQRHMDAVKVLLDRYGIADPIMHDEIGIFTNTAFQTLYSELVAQGSTGITEALIVGATIEDLDIADLEEWTASADNEDIMLVYSNLMRGSRNHLRAFTRNLQSEGATYTPQYISAEEYASIISTPTERGAGRP